MDSYQKSAIILSLILFYFTSVSLRAENQNFAIEPLKSVITDANFDYYAHSLDADEVAAQMNLQTPNKNGWRVSVTPVLWLPPVSGTQEKAGLTADLEASQADRVERFKPSGELFLEFTNGAWTFVFQPHYVNVDVDGSLTTPIGDVPLEVNAKILSLEFWGAKRFNFKKNNGWVELLAGVKYTELNSVSVSIFGEDTTEFDWINPIVGARAHIEVYGPLSIESQVTASGFKLTANSSNEQEARVALQYQTSRRTTVQTGYRYQKVDVEEQKPVPTRLNYTVKGPYIAFTYRIN